MAYNEDETYVVQGQPVEQQQQPYYPPPEQQYAEPVGTGQTTMVVVDNRGPSGQYFSKVRQNSNVMIFCGVITMIYGFLTIFVFAATDTYRGFLLIVSIMFLTLETILCLAGGILGNRGTANETKGFIGGMIAMLILLLFLYLGNMFFNAWFGLVWNIVGLLFGIILIGMFLRNSLKYYREISHGHDGVHTVTTV